ncbi:MAG TPA: type III-B CRISPR module-associated Cmr3 family protein [Streptosporangiaceae bacterium]|nr:type III-B CRISPR module-associated Cmr3 family protein [Streptosporangiaceae bacterium]
MSTASRQAAGAGESTWLAFRPRDTLFIRDGRDFDAAADTAGMSVRPSPTTVAGAAAAVLGGDPDEVRGPVLARLTGGDPDAYFPVPADLARTPGSGPARVHRLVPRHFDGAATDLDDKLIAGGPGRPRWLGPPDDVGAVEPLTGLIPADRLAAYLAGELPARTGSALGALGRIDDPFALERRVGLARDGRRARAGYLYQVTHLRAQDDWAYLAQCAFAAGEAKSPRSPQVKLGGRGRLADVTETTLAWPGGGRPVGQRVLAYLATPALWPGGWRIPERDGAHLVAAACGKPLPAATLTPGERWRESRVQRWAVPAGSVYLLEFDDAPTAVAWAARYHGTAYGPGEPSPELEHMRTAGFGVVLTGVWDD